MPPETWKAAWLCLFLLINPTTLLASDEIDVQRKFQPFETRDQNLFNLINGQAMPTNARLNKKSRGLLSTSLVITNTLNVESDTNEDIYLDYEAYRFNLSYQYGLDNNWNIKFDVPVIYQGGGVFDSAIDNWHSFWGMPRGSRPLVADNQYHIRYDEQTQALVDLSQGSTALGDIQLAVARALVDNNSTSLSLWAALKLPTGDEDKLTSNGATDVSAWLAWNQQLSNNWLINLNSGAVIPGTDNYQDIPLSDFAVYGHLMLSWLVTDAIHLKLQLQGHSSYYEQSQLTALGDTYFLTFGGSIMLDQCNQLDLAFSEDIKVEASPDASLIISWRSYTSGC